VADDPTVTVTMTRDQAYLVQSILEMRRQLEFERTREVSAPGFYTKRIKQMAVAEKALRDALYDQDP
jgi:hypothetical protein